MGLDISAPGDEKELSSKFCEGFRIVKEFFQFR